MTKSNLGAYMALMLSAGIDYKSRSHGGVYGHGIPTNPKKIIHKGCNEYTIQGITVVALNEKSAIKKVNRILSKKS